MPSSTRDMATPRKKGLFQRIIFDTYFPHVNKGRNYLALASHNYEKATNTCGGTPYCNYGHSRSSHKPTQPPFLTYLPTPQHLCNPPLRKPRPQKLSPSAYRGVCSAGRRKLSPLFAGRGFRHSPGTLLSTCQQPTKNLPQTGHNTESNQQPSSSYQRRHICVQPYTRPAPSQLPPKSHQKHTAALRVTDPVHEAPVPDQ